MKLSILFLILIIHIVCQSRNLPLMGSYQAYTDLTSLNFQNILKFVISNHPQLSSYQIRSVQRQLVNGFNYIIYQTDGNCIAKSEIYSTFAGELTETSFSQSCAAQQNTHIAGGYTVQAIPSGDAFEYALSQALSQNPQYSRDNLIKTETQVVAGTNYRFTFQNQDGTTSQVVIFVPLGPLPSSQPTEDILPPRIRGGFSQVTNPSEYADILKLIYSKYPQVTQYSVDSVYVQIVAGKNYQVNLSDNNNKLASASFTVYVDLQGNAVVSQILWVDVIGYSKQEIDQAVASSNTLHPELSGYNLKSVQNIWPNGEGLKLLFENDQGSKKVYIYSAKGQSYNLIM